MAPESNAMQANGAISLNVDKEKLVKALAYLPGSYSIDKEIPDSTEVSANVSDASLEEALTSMLSPSGLTYAMDGRTYKIIKQPPVSLAVTHQPFSAVAGLIFGALPYEFRDGADPDFPVTANIQAQPLDRALSTIVGAKDYHWKREGDRYVVFRDKEATFTMDFPALSQSFSVSSSRAAGSMSGGSSGGSSTTSGAGGSSGSTSPTTVTSTSSATSKADISSMDNLITTVKEMLSKDGKISSNKELGLLWVKDHADVVDRVGGFMKATNDRFHRAVNIKGIITEVNFTDSKEIGVDWNYVVSNALTGVIATGAAKMSPAMALQFNWDSNKEKAYIAALKTFGNVKVVSKPQLMVANGAIGSLTVGETISYVAQAYTSNVGTSSQTSSLEVQPLQVGLSFYVIPKIINDREAVIYISPDLTTLQEIRTINNQSLTVEAPHITQKQTQTVVPVKNGEKILISGLMADTVTKNVTGVPILMDLPWIGTLFKHTTNSVVKTEFALMLEVRW